MVEIFIGRNRTRDKQLWLIDGTLFVHLKRIVNNIKMEKKFRHNQGMIMILSCFLMDSLRNTLTVVLMHFTQRKTKSINYWLTNSPTCPAVSFFVVYNDTFYQLTTEVLIGECILNICNCIFLSDRSFYLLNWHILIEIYCINYKLFISNPNIKRHLWSNNSTF